MKRIKIFLASSITDLELDRIRIGDFIRQLNDIYFDRGYYFSLVRCDDYDNSIAAEGKQSQFDREIRDSELCFFLFFRKVGDYTRHEFEIALDAFKNSQKPKIVTYFKYVETPDEATGEVKAFMQMLDGEIKHYYNIYQSIDTLKLGILMQVKMMKLDAEELAVENGKVTFGKMEVADTRNLPVFSGNRTLAELKAEAGNVAKEYYELRERHLENPDDLELCMTFSRIATEKAELEKQLREAEKAVLEASKKMYEITGKGSLSARQVAAYRAFERGDYRDALEILNLDEIMTDLLHDEKIAEGGMECVQVHVNEFLQRIEILKADGVDQSKAEEIGRIYETVRERIDTFNLNKDPLYDYACFLYVQNDHEKAIDVAKQLAYYYSNPNAPADDDKQADLWGVLGVLYADMHHYTEAEEAYKKALEIRKRLTEQNPAKFESDLAFSYNNLGIFFKTMYHYAEAENAFKEALKIRKRLVDDNPTAAYESNLADSHNNLGNLYGNTQRHEEAEAEHKKALEIRKRLAEQDPAKFESDLALSYNNLGGCYSATGRFEEAEDAHKEALKICERLAKQNPAAFEPALARSYHNLGNLYCKMRARAEARRVFGMMKKNNDPEHLSDIERNEKDVKRYEEEAKNNLQEALKIYKRLAQRNPKVFMPDLALIYKHLGDFDRDPQRYAEAEDAYKKAIEIQKKLAEKQPAAFEPNLANSYAALGALYISVHRYEEAEGMSKEVIKIRKRLAENNPVVFEPLLAKSYNSLAVLYRDRFNSPESYRNMKDAYQHALVIAEKYPQDIECQAIVRIAKDRLQDNGPLADRDPEKADCHTVSKSLKNFLQRKVEK